MFPQANSLVKFSTPVLVSVAGKWKVKYRQKSAIEAAEKRKA
jgi:hypothetical protein